MKCIVGFSGGIDSQAALRWVRENHPGDEIIALNSTVGGHEHWLTSQFISDYSRDVFPVHQVEPIMADLWITPGYAEKRGFRSEDPLSFLQMIMVKGRPPSRKAQFCTEILKLRPALRWMKQNIKHHVFEHKADGIAWDEKVVRYTGLRQDESDPRKETPEVEWDDWFCCELRHPVRLWTKQQCFDYVRSFGEPINPLYTLGFNRVGCAPCINEGRQGIRNWVQRDPAVIDRVRMYERKSGRTFFAPMVPGKPTNNIDDVVEWALCDRGGKQYSLEVLIPAPVCESKYGLCE